jgi:NADH-quinone oxidoreductase subunit A
LRSSSGTTVPTRGRAIVPYLDCGLERGDDASSDAHSDVHSNAVLGLWTRFVTRKDPPHILRPTPNNPATEARVTEFYRQYLAVAVFFMAAFGMVGAMLGMARLLRPKVPQDEKYITYESGSDPLPLFGQMNVRYYVYALLFVIFDVEAVFIFPWAVNVDALSWFGLIEMTAFIAILLLGLAYVWRKGLLRWA